MEKTIYTEAVLGSEAILARFQRGEIFQPHTWVETNLRAAAYDLRLADDFLIVPDAEFPSGRRYNRGEKRKDPIILQPGDVAFLSTMERLCMPWDLTANIGIKFGFSRYGILVLTGLLVDPGFGLGKNDSGGWVPKKDERLHFLLANVGPHSVVISPGQKIASIQFFKVSGPVKKVYVPSGVDMETEFFDLHTKPKVGLVFFRNMAQLQNKFDKLKQNISIIKQGTNQIVVFRIYLLGATLLVAGFTVLLSFIASDRTFLVLQRLATIIPATWPQAIIVICVLGAGTYCCHRVLKHAASMLARKL